MHLEFSKRGFFAALSIFLLEVFMQLNAIAAFLRLCMGCQDVVYQGRKPEQPEQPDSPDAAISGHSKKYYKRQRRKRSC
jgi:hypothetical protein